jgi:hypothetical protein
VLLALAAVDFLEAEETPADVQAKPVPDVSKWKSTEVTGVPMAEDYGP